MRMWMVDPEIMCQKHLCGEHVELHMFLGHLKKRRKVDGYIKNNCLEIRGIFYRHYQVEREMLRRGYKPKSPMKESDFECIYDYPQEQIHHRVNVVESYKDLLSRCPKCKERYLRKLMVGCPSQV